MSQVTPVDVARDRAGLREFLPLFFAQAARASDPVRGPRSEVRGPEAATTDHRPRTTDRLGIPFGYRRWIEHLLSIDGLEGIELTADEAVGLREVRAARDEFWERHKRCPGREGRSCGRVLPAHTTWCDCGWKQGK